jgi:hypothetical protein
MDNVKVVPVLSEPTQEFLNDYKSWGGSLSPLNETIYNNCLRFLNSLPIDYPIPEFSLNPNGTISIDWETQYGCASLEIGKTKYSLYIKRCDGSSLLQDGVTTEIENNIMKDCMIWTNHELNIMLQSDFLQLHNWTP